MRHFRAGTFSAPRGEVVHADADVQHALADAIGEHPSVDARPQRPLIVGATQELAHGRLDRVRRPARQLDEIGVHGSARRIVKGQEQGGAVAHRALGDGRPEAH